MNKDKIFQLENDKLIGTISIIQKAKTFLGKTMNEIGAFNLQKLKELREDPATNATDFFQFIEMLDTKSKSFNIKDKYKKLEELEYLEKQPYFSRIALKDPKTGVEESHYIGKFGYTEETPIIIDWRAKVASVYYKYRFPQKEVVYDTPEGPVTKDLTLKRTFEIDNGALLKYYNNDIQLDEDEIIVDKIQDRTGGVLEDIVETIQEGQHEIIEADPRRVCVVQGTVGSGKSTVAIHKLSHIFFNYTDLIKPEKSILIAKSQILVGYLSTLFPKLGIFGINYGTLRDVLFQFMFKENVKLKFNFDKNTDVSDFAPEDISTLEQRLELLHEVYEEAIDVIFEPDDFSVFAGHVYDNSMSVYENINEIISDLEEEHKLQKDFLKEHPGHTKEILFKTNIKTLGKIIRKLAALRTKLRKNEIPKLIKEFNLMDGGELGYLQTLIYIFIHAQLIGIRRFEKYQYCVVDEGQDFSVLEYYILNKFVQHGRFCILGDLNQSYVDEGLGAWEEINEVISGAKNAHTFELDTNYRSTRPIIEFANTILGAYTQKYLPKSISRAGAAPEIVSLGTNNDILSEFEKDIKESVENQDKSIGVICFSDDLYDQTEKILDSIPSIQDRIVKLREKDRIEYSPRGVYLTHFVNCKGLEFGKVYILGLDLEKVTTFVEAKKAFVAVTRAMNDLKVYSAKNE